MPLLILTSKMRLQHQSKSALIPLKKWFRQPKQVGTSKYKQPIRVKTPWINKMTSIDTASQWMTEMRYKWFNIFSVFFLFHLIVIRKTREYFIIFWIKIRYNTRRGFLIRMYRGYRYFVVLRWII